jgi:hypothetical protein
MTLTEPAHTVRLAVRVPRDGRCRDRRAPDARAPDHIPEPGVAAPTHGEPDEDAFHRLLQAAVSLKAKDAPQGARDDARRCRVGR